MAKSRGRHSRRSLRSSRVAHYVAGGALGVAALAAVPSIAGAEEAPAGRQLSPEDLKIISELPPGNYKGSMMSISQIADKYKQAVKQANELHGTTDAPADPAPAAPAAPAPAPAGSDKLPPLLAQAREALGGDADGLKEFDKAIADAGGVAKVNEAFAAFPGGPEALTSLIAQGPAIVAQLTDGFGLAGAAGLLPAPAAHTAPAAHAAAAHAAPAAHAAAAHAAPAAHAAAAHTAPGLPSGVTGGFDPAMATTTYDQALAQALASLHGG